MQGRIRISGKTDDKKYLGKIREEHRMGKGGNIATTRISKSTKKIEKNTKFENGGESRMMQGKRDGPNLWLYRVETMQRTQLKSWENVVLYNQRCSREKIIEKLKIDIN